MTWMDVRKHANDQLDEYALEMLREHIPDRLELFRQGSAAAIDGLEFWYSRILAARGPAFVRRELEPIEHVLPQSIAALVKDCAGDHALSSMPLGYANATNLFETVGFAVPPAALLAFRPLILRVETHPQDIPGRHWTKGLMSLALGEHLGWVPIAGFLRVQDVPFVPRATFEFNVQGLIGHLGGALRSGAALDDVLPAWHQFMFVAPMLMSVHQLDERVILWVARVVFHHIGKHPLGTVADRVFEEIDRLVAASA